MPTTKSLIALCGTWLKSWNKWNTQKCAVWSQKTSSSDGRKVDEIRPLDAQVDYLSSCSTVSGLFLVDKRKPLSVLTLAPMGEAQIIDGLDPEYKKRFMHHYNFLFSVETGRYGTRSSWNWSRGSQWACSCSSLAKFGRIPLRYRLVAEVLESNSFFISASICAGTLACYGWWCSRRQ